MDSLSQVVVSLNDIMTDKKSEDLGRIQLHQIFVSVSRKNDAVYELQKEIFFLSR